MAECQNIHNFVTVYVNVFENKLEYEFLKNLISKDRKICFDSYGWINLETIRSIRMLMFRSKTIHSLFRNIFEHLEKRQL